MITAGMDLGSRNTKVVILRDGKVIAAAKQLTGFEQEVTAMETLKEAAASAGIAIEDIEYIVATGAGRKVAPFAKETVTEMSAAARGAFKRNSALRTVLDIGAEEGRAILISDDGRVKDFAVNEKCAAGAGTFIESMSRALEIKLEDFGPLANTSENPVPMNAQCAVFAESEVVSLMHARTPKPDIARAVLDAIANRIVSMARRISITADVGLIGGLAYNPGFVASLQRTLGMNVWVPADPEYIPAQGAAWLAAERLSTRAAVNE